MLYSGSAVPGAENWACLASLIETCKLNGVDPQAYLTDVLTKLVNAASASFLVSAIQISCSTRVWPWAAGSWAIC